MKFKYKPGQSKKKGDKLVIDLDGKDDDEAPEADKAGEAGEAGEADRADRADRADEAGARKAKHEARYDPYDIWRINGKTKVVKVEEEVRYACAYCEKTFANEGHLARHVNKDRSTK